METDPDPAAAPAGSHTSLDVSSGGELATRPAAAAQQPKASAVLPISALHDVQSDDVDGRWEPMRLFAHGLRRALGVAMLLAAFSVPSNLGVAYMLNMGINERVDEGAEVRLPYEEKHTALWSGDGNDMNVGEDALVSYSGFLMAVIAIQCARGSVRSRGLAQPNRWVRLGEVVIVTFATVIPWCGAGWSFLGTWFYCATWSTLQSAPARRMARSLASALTIYLVMVILYQNQLSTIMSESWSDSNRIAWRLVVHTALFETPVAVCRLWARYATDPREVHVGLMFAATAHMTDSLFSRMLIAEMRSVGSAVLLVGLLSALELLLRLTQRRRDNWLARTLCWRDVAESPLAHQVAAHDVMLSEVTESWATVVTLSSKLFMRAGVERQAPAAGPYILSALLQLLTEAFVDLVPGLAASVTNYAPLRRSVVRRGRAAGEWTPRFVGFLVLSALTISSMLMRIQFTFRYATYCPWTKRGGWWHVVPCGLSESWLGGG